MLKVSLLIDGNSCGASRAAKDTTGALTRLGRAADSTGAKTGKASRDVNALGAAAGRAKPRLLGAARLPGRGLGAAGPAAGAFLVGRGIGGATNAAADAEELQSMFEAVFKELSDDAEKWADTHAAAVNRSQLDLRAYLATAQDTFAPLGFARKDAAALSKQLTETALDVASFKNAQDAETIDLFTSAKPCVAPHFRTSSA